MQIVRIKKTSMGVRPRRTGFTLIEITVAMAIVVLLVGLLAGWLIGYSQRAKVSSLESAMSSAGAAVEVAKKKTVWSLDHRYANTFWIDPRLNGVFDAGSARRMSSTEYFVFSASKIQAAAAILESVGPNYFRTPTPSAAGLWDPATEVFVEVWEQNAQQAQIQYKATCPTLDAAGSPVPGAPTYTMVSPAGGHHLRTLMDPWGHEWIYRFSAHADVLNGLPSYTTTPANGTSWTNLETIAGDAEVAGRQDKASGPVQPAVAAYAYPFFASAGPDGKWGALQDGVPPNFTRNALADSASGNRDADAKDNVYSVPQKGR